MTLDWAGIIRGQTDQVLAAHAADADGTVSWCGDWRVSDVVEHLAIGNVMAARIIEGRPTTDRSVRETIVAPHDPGALAGWLDDGTDDLLAQLAAASLDDECWSLYPPDQTVGFWARRRAQEAVVHRWDAERGAGVDVTPLDPAVAADGIDEYLDVFLGFTRVMFEAPGDGESFHVHCTDTEGEWLIRFPAPGERELTREHAKGDVAMRGTAEALLLHLWDRDGGPVEVLGDEAVAARWRELAPQV